MAVLVTGGAGFIGSNFVAHLLNKGAGKVVTLDALTYAGNPANLDAFRDDPRHVFVKGSILDAKLVSGLLKRHGVTAIVNFAAESHVDRSIRGPQTFIETNITGTFRLLEVARAHWRELPPAERDAFRYLQVSTDEVFGALQPGEPRFNETTAFQPNSPYAASKAAADHLVRAWHETYGLPTLTSNCSNNYGPYQFPEKLIPLVIHKALSGEALPVYGDGQQVRDWLHVEDHCRALSRILEQGMPGETYAVGGDSERTNLDVVRSICALLEHHRPIRGRSYAEQIAFVTDRPGHDRRYAIDASKLKRDLGWLPAESFESGLEKTVLWYLENQDWVRNVTSGAYRDWVAEHYA
jgi:dTDP-glucose 4,6-dehydratase